MAQSHEIQPIIITMPPAADYSAKVGFVVYNNAGTATLTANATTIPLGIIVDGGIDANSKISVCVYGPCRGSIGNTVTYDDWLVSDGSAELIPSTGANDYVVARPLQIEQSDDGDTPMVFVMCALKFKIFV